MSNESQAQSFEDQMRKIIADVESSGSINDTHMLELEVSFALCGLFWVSHRAMSSSDGQVVTVAKLTTRQETHRELSRAKLEIIASRSQERIGSERKESAKQSLLAVAKSADMLVRLVTCAMSKSSSSGDRQS